MLLNELTPAQVSTLLEAECTDAELTEAIAAVRQFSEAVVECLRRGAGQSIAEGLLLANELQKARACFACRIGRVIASARRRYLDRTLHGDGER